MSGFDLIIRPDEDEADAAGIFVDGSIGARPYHFLLDTGAAKTSVIADAYTSAFASAEKDSSSGVFARSSEDLITVPSVAVGSIARANFTLVRRDAASPRINNLIGIDFLKNYRCHFVFDENRVSVDAEDEATYPPQALYLDSRFHPYVDVRFGTLIAKAVWDTGASITIVDVGFVSKHPALFEEVGHSTGTDSTGAQQESAMFLMSASTIGEAKFAPLKAAGVDLAQVNASLEMPMDLILGYNALRQANWRFDFPRRQWAISKRLDVR